MFGLVECFCGCKCPNHIGVATLVTILVWVILRLEKAAIGQHPRRTS